MCEGKLQQRPQKNGDVSDMEYLVKKSMSGKLNHPKEKAFSVAQIVCSSQLPQFKLHAGHRITGINVYPGRFWYCFFFFFQFFYIIPFSHFEMRTFTFSSCMLERTYVLFDFYRGLELRACLKSPL